MSETLGLPIEPEWLDGVVRFFETARGMADLLAKAGVSESSEPAPVFTPQPVSSASQTREPRS